MARSCLLLLFLLVGLLLGTVVPSAQDKRAHFVADSPRYSAGSGLLGSGPDLAQSMDPQNQKERQFDGHWYSPEWDYAFLINGRTGIATRSNSPNYAVGQLMLRIQRVEGQAFSGEQIFTDGRWVPVSAVLTDKATLRMQGGGYRWIMKRRDEGF